MMNKFFGWANLLMGLFCIAESMMAETHQITFGVCAFFFIGSAGCLLWAAHRSRNWEGKAPTSAQLDFARKLGVNVPANASRGDVSNLIDAAKAAKHA